MSASVIWPVGVVKTRVLPGPSGTAPLPVTKLRFAAVLAMVIKVTPSPAPEGLTSVSGTRVSMKFTLAASDQRRRALRAACATSVPGLTFVVPNAVGLKSDSEKATVIVLTGQRVTKPVEVY